MSSPSIEGDDYSQARSFKVAYTTSNGGTAVAIASGAYSITCDSDCIVGLTTSATGISALGTSQPAVTSPNRSVMCTAGVAVGFTVGSSGQFISGVGISASGTLYVSGPIHTNNTTR